MSNRSQAICFMQGECEQKDCKNLSGHNKLDVSDWLYDIPKNNFTTKIVEVRFKNTRKGFFVNSNDLRLGVGDVVAVEAATGHDIGMVSLLGELVWLQMAKNNFDPKTSELKKIYRKAKLNDIEKWKEAIDLENITMLKSRKIAESLKLEMKIGDVEYQGDRTKAIFYYIADDRVDFRELIKILADEFKIRVEMRQIGARQEAGRIGGVGACGRELCCSTWISSFVSVTTNSARYQEIALNPQKLAGQCSKLKCCLNYELDCYMDARKDFPDTAITLETKQGTLYHQKSDVFRALMWYSYNQESSMNMIPVPVERVKKIIELNQQGKVIEKLIEDDFNDDLETSVLDYNNLHQEDSLSRFDGKKKRKKKKKKQRP